MGHIVQYTQMSVTAAVALASIPASVTTVDLIAEGTIRYRSDGTNPTAAVGMPILANQPVTFAGDQIGQVRVIAVSGTVTVNLEYGYGG